ncbi:autoinducer transcriptional regulator protein [Stappia sp. 22II-S9-Z10]|nr:autoinducer transcriptional regulator protein [Stappia sp. 22II-S9-Z10]
MGKRPTPTDDDGKAGGAAGNVVDEVRTARSMNRAVRLVRDHFAMVLHVTYVAARYGADPQKDPYVRTTYPPTWLVRYLFKQYWRVDPVGREGFSRTTPFMWHELFDGTPEVDEFFADAQRHGLGRTGLLIPLTNRANQRGILSLNSDEADDVWEDFAFDALPVFLEIGQILHTRATMEIFGEAPPARLSPREKEMLHWISLGKEVPDIAIITSLSEHTVRTYLKSARMKLDASTMAQAVVKAERLGLLAEPR